MPAKTIDYLVAVSAFETTGWTSNVYKQSRNPFNIILKGSNRLPFGEGQTVYPTVEDGVNALVDHVWRPYKYPLFYDNIDSLTHAMKQKGFYEFDEIGYTKGVKFWADKLNIVNQ